jgi:hypothetical protein
VDCQNGRRNRATDKAGSLVNLAASIIIETAVGRQVTWVSFTAAFIHQTPGVAIYLSSLQPDAAKPFRIRFHHCPTFAPLQHLHTDWTLNFSLFVLKRYERSRTADKTYVIPLCFRLCRNSNKILNHQVLIPLLVVLTMTFLLRNLNLI